MSFFANFKAKRAAKKAQKKYQQQLAAEKPVLELLQIEKKAIS